MQLSRSYEIFRVFSSLVPSIKTRMQEEHADLMKLIVKKNTVNNDLERADIKIAF